MKKAVSVKGTDIESKVIGFVSDELKIDKSKLDYDTRLFHDLGVDGDDAIELIEGFARKFDVNVAGFPYEKYFGLEVSFSPFSIISRLLGKQRKFQPLCVSDLVNAAVRHKF